MKKAILIAMLALLPILALAAPDKQQSEVTDAGELMPAVDRIRAERTLDAIAHLGGLWKQAHERRDQPSEIRLEKEILHLVQVDIFKSENSLLHHQKTLKDAQERGYGEKAYAAEDDPVVISVDLLARMRSMISAKEAIATTFLRSKDFSHKYRLLSDYQYLLRSQLKMPKVRLADRDAAPGRTKAGTE